MMNQKNENTIDTVSGESMEWTPADSANDELMDWSPMDSPIDNSTDESFADNEKSICEMDWMPSGSIDALNNDSTESLSGKTVDIRRCSNFGTINIINNINNYYQKN